MPDDCGDGEGFFRRFFGTFPMMRMMVPSGRVYITPEIFNIVEAEKKTVGCIDVSPFSRGVCSGYMLVFGGVALYIWMISCLYFLAGIPVFWGRFRWCLEDHPRTCKWFITMVDN